MKYILLNMKEAKIMVLDAKDEEGYETGSQ